jgi:hypothetical protein
VEAFDTEEELSAALCLEVFENAKACIEDRGAFSLAIPGGSVAKALKGLCELEDEGLDWSKMHVFFVNERPEEQKCYNLARTTWVDEFIAQGKFKLENLHKVMENAEDLDGVAKDYEAQMFALAEDEVFYLSQFSASERREHLHERFRRGHAREANDFDEFTLDKSSRSRGRRGDRRRESRNCKESVGGRFGVW